MGQLTILLVGHDPALRGALKEVLRCYGTIQELDVCTSLLAHLEPGEIDLLILGSTSGHSPDSIKLIHTIREICKDLPIIFLTVESSERLAIEAIRAGVQDYFKSPFDIGEIAASAGRILRNLPLRGEATCSGSNAGCADDHLIGSSKAMREIKRYISQVACTTSNVLLTGETGTGKELVAQSIHRKSARGEKPFVCINCAAVPDTLMESEFFGYERGAFTGANSNKQGKLAMANGGTVFFDEIGDMTSYMQAKVLRAIEGKEIQPLGGRGSVSLDFRVIAATNHDLDRLAAEGKFRPDLYFRLNVGRIHLPPLRERKEDIPALIDFYIEDLNLRFEKRVEGLAGGVMDLLLRYSWPGNIRELKNVLEAAYVQIPSGQRCALGLPDSFRKYLLNSVITPPQNERDQLVSTLAATNWNKSATAQKMHLSRMTLYRKMAKYQIMSSKNTGRSEKDGDAAAPTTAM